MKQLMVLALGISMVFGSTDSHAFIGKEITEVDYSDGVSKKEAKFLAKQYINKENMRDSLYGTSPYKTEHAIYFCNEDESICTGSDLSNACEKNNELCEVALAKSFKAYEDVNIETEAWVLFYRNKCCSLLWGAIPFMPTIIVVDKTSGNVLSVGVLK